MYTEINKAYLKAVKEYDRISGKEHFFYVDMYYNSKKDVNL